MMMGKLLVDFGLVILIWMTQLVVYPSFSYYQASDLVRWHQRYTTAISLMVMPLMLGQLALHTYDLFQGVYGSKVFCVLLISLAWVNTFFYAVPLHQKIAAGKEVLAAAKDLATINWYRTALWSATFLVSLYQYVRSA